MILQRTLCTPGVARAAMTILLSCAPPFICLIEMGIRITEGFYHVHQCKREIKGDAFCASMHALCTYPENYRLSKCETSPACCASPW